MHAMLVHMALDPDRGADVQRHFDQDVVPWARQQAGFVSGYWLRSGDGEQGLGMVLFETAAAATAAAAGPTRAPRVDGRAWNIERVTVFEVAARADGTGS
jgi:hypothetical protein